MNKILLGYRFLWVPLGLFTWALTMAFVSGLIGLGDIKYEERQVGYLGSVNWTLTFVVLAPVLCLVIFVIVREMRLVLNLIVKRSMCVDLGTRTVVNSTEKILFGWRQIVQRGVAIWMVLSGLALALSMLEWRENSLDPLLRYETLDELDAAEREAMSSEISLARSDRLVERDWAIAPLLTSKANERSTLPFTCLAWMMQGVLFAIILWLITVAASFGVFVMSLALGRDGLRLVPSIDAVEDEQADPRRGFGIFENVGLLLMVSSIVVASIAYCTIVHNAYLRSANAKDILEFVKGPFASGSERSAGGLIAFAGIDFSTVMVLISGYSVLVLVFLIVPIGVLVAAALKAKQNLCDIVGVWTPEEVQAAFRRSPAAVRKRADSMTAWPYQYFNFNVLIILVVLTFLSLVIYTIVPFFLGVAFSSVLYVGIKVIRDHFELKRSA